MSPDETADAVEHSFQAKPCRVCGNVFTPPRDSTSISTDDNHKTHCASCRRAVKDASKGLDAPSEGPVLHNGPGAPMRQIVFDLETWGLDRGWGVTLVASFLIHGGAEGPKRITIKHRDSQAWKSGKRSDDREMATEVFRILSHPGTIAYAHNGDRFDIPWLRSVALKYGLQMPRTKLIDPCAIAWKRYRIGRNSLEALSDFLGLDQFKMHVSPETWRGALMDDDEECWRILVARCESDVDLLNAAASRVTGDVNLIDYQGSWR